MGECLSKRVGVGLAMLASVSCAPVSNPMAKSASVTPATEPTSTALSTAADGTLGPALPKTPFVVFFDWNKADITAKASAILDNAAAAYARTGKASVMVTSYTDGSGHDEYNVGLSQRRADAVKAYLASRGVDDSLIATTAFGESKQPEDGDEEGVRDPHNRRVEVTFSPSLSQ